MIGLRGQNNLVNLHTMQYRLDCDFFNMIESYLMFKFILIIELD